MSHSTIAVIILIAGFIGAMAGYALATDRIFKDCDDVGGWRATSGTVFNCSRR